MSVSTPPTALSPSTAIATNAESMMKMVSSGTPASLLSVRFSDMNQLSAYATPMQAAA